MSNFMRQDGHQLLWGVLLQKGIVEHYLFLLAKAREKCICLGRTATAIHHENMLDRKVDLRGILQQFVT